MNNQETSAKEHVSPEEHPVNKEGLSSNGSEAQTPRLAAPEHYQENWSAPSPPFVPITHPSTWSTYTPGMEQMRYRPYRSSYTRRNVIWPWIVLGSAVLFILLATGAFFLAVLPGGTSVTEAQHFSVRANPTLVLNNDTGSIHVLSGASNGEVAIEATKRGGSLGNTNDIHVNYAQDVTSAFSRDLFLDR